MIYFYNTADILPTILPMALAPDLSKSAASDLQTVSIICISKTPEIQLWIEALEKNGAEMLNNENIHTLQDITRQKLAVILDQDISEDEKYEVIEKYEILHRQDTKRSFRFFECIWDKEVSNENDRLRIIDIMDMAPNAFPARINRSLFKSRLPAFLRKNYDVEISDQLEEIAGTQYRPITIRKYRGIGEERLAIYEALHLYIHEKRLYSKCSTGGECQMREIIEGGRILVKKCESAVPAAFLELDILMDTSVEE